VSNLFLIAYDTPDDLRRRRFARVLDGWGQRVQDSVYEAWLEARQLSHLMGELQALADPVEDSIRIYRLCGRDVADVLHRGMGDAPQDRDPPIV
jgi:CRISPR-associated protein Cas2